MKAICEDGTTVECEQCKAIDNGLLLFSDEDRESLIGFVPTRQLRYLLPDDTTPGGSAQTAESSLRSPQGPPQGGPGHGVQQPAQNYASNTTRSPPRQAPDSQHPQETYQESPQAPTQW